MVREFPLHLLRPGEAAAKCLRRRADLGSEKRQGDAFRFLPTGAAKTDAQFPQMPPHRPRPREPVAFTAEEHVPTSAADVGDALRCLLAAMEADERVRWMMYGRRVDHSPAGSSPGVLLVITSHRPAGAPPCS